MKLTHFEQLDCWKSARELMKLAYTYAEKEEMQKQFELKGQFLRASISIMNNIAEGFGRYHKKDYIRFLNMAIASAHELRSMSYVMVDQDFIATGEQQVMLEQIEKTQNLTGGLIRYLVKSETQPDTTLSSPEHVNT